MFKLADTTLATLPLSLVAAAAVAAAAALALLLPPPAQAGITTLATVEPPKAQGLYQIRCWQQGRLLFEENHITLPADAAKYGIKMNGTDRNGKPIYVADTANATCLIRSVDDERAWPR
jgi:hypothetical protein